MSNTNAHYEKATFGGAAEAGIQLRMDRNLFLTAGVGLMWISRMQKTKIMLYIQPEGQKPTIGQAAWKLVLNTTFYKHLMNKYISFDTSYL